MFGNKDPPKPAPRRIIGHYKVRSLLRTPEARTKYDPDSLMFLVEYPPLSGLSDEFLPYKKIKDSGAWQKYAHTFLTPRIGQVVGRCFEGTPIISYSNDMKIEVKDAAPRTNLTNDRKRRSTDSDAAFSSGYTPKKSRPSTFSHSFIPKGHPQPQEEKSKCSII